MLSNLTVGCSSRYCEQPANLGGKANKSRTRTMQLPAGFIQPKFNFYSAVNCFCFLFIGFCFGICFTSISYYIRFILDTAVEIIHFDATTKTTEDQCTIQMYFAIWAQMNFMWKQEFQLEFEYTLSTYHKCILYLTLVLIVISLSNNFHNEVFLFLHLLHRYV